MEFLWHRDRKYMNQLNEACSYIIEALEGSEPLKLPEALAQALALVRCSPAVVTAIIDARFAARSVDHAAMEAALDRIPQEYIRYGVREYFRIKDTVPTPSQSSDSEKEEEEEEEEDKKEKEIQRLKQELQKTMAERDTLAKIVNGVRKSIGVPPF
jgi:hypothetical protein